MDKRNLIQEKASDSWWKAGGIGTINAHTGFGKNFTMFRCVRFLPEGSNVLFLSEVVDRERDVRDELDKYFRIFGYNIGVNYNFTFRTYQGSYKKSNEKWDLVVADEIHFGCTPIYSMFFENNKYDYILGLSATVDDPVFYDDPENFSKKIIMNKIAPVVFKYSLIDGRKNGTSRPLNIFIVNHRLDSENKNVEAGNKNNRFHVTETKMYKYYEGKYKEAESSFNQFLKRKFAGLRSRFLYNLKSKEDVINRVLSTIEGKTILFGNSLDSLLRITPNVVCSRYSKEKNEQIRESFESNEFNVIGSMLKLKQGANLDGGIDNIVLHSYYGKRGSFQQQIGRSRKEGLKYGNVIILRTLGTREENWCANILSEFPNDVFNIIKCNSISEFKGKYSNRDKYEVD